MCSVNESVDLQLLTRWDFADFAPFFKISATDSDYWIIFSRFSQKYAEFHQIKCTFDDFFARSRLRGTSENDHVCLAGKQTTENANFHQNFWRFWWKFRKILQNFTKFLQNFAKFWKPCWKRSFRMKNALFYVKMHFFVAENGRKSDSVNHIPNVL